MQTQSVTSTRHIMHPHDELSENSYYHKEERRRTGRYVAVAAAFVILLIGFFHIFARGASSTIAGICIPAAIMATYIIWMLYAARRDRIKAERLASMAYLVEVISDSSTIQKDCVKNHPTLIHQSTTQK
uniref:Uncharacterized protein n=1 Tax=Trichogramma kaykai TaxID=54128 RepID=A0ABD2WXL1_9HYME